MRTRIKICGITRVQDARAAVAGGADAIGFVFWNGSPRRIDAARAARIGRALPPLVARVGVFVNATPAAVARTVRMARLDVVQLHGDEDPRDYARCGAAMIKAVSLETAEDVRRARALPADVVVLVDARDPQRRGGTGRRSNWPLARALARQRPTVLAGGLKPTTVARAIRNVRPWGVDVSSGVEVAPGLKSGKKIAAFCAAVARADQGAK